MLPSHLLVRSLARKPRCNLYAAQTRGSFTNKYRHGPQAIANPKPDKVQWVKDFFTKEAHKELLSDAKGMLDYKFRGNWKAPTPGQFNIFEDFDSNEALKRWKTAADSTTQNGFSTASLTKSPAGHALFSGILDTRIPDDGLTMNSGFACMIGPGAPMRTLSTDSYWDWTGYDVLEIKCRGDGRKYSVVLSVADYGNDLHYYDAYSFPLYTRGGPYWQTHKFAFSKFIFNHKGFIQDEQSYLATYKIKFVALVIQDNIDGPYSLEVDYLGLRNEPQPYVEDTPYEGYTHPHIKYRAIQVDCEAPERY